MRNVHALTGSYHIYLNGCHEYTANSLRYALRYVGGKQAGWGLKTCQQAVAEGWRIVPC